MTENASNRSKSKFKWFLVGVFLFALIMGPGPGIYLVNGYAAEGGTILGMPALYFWAVLWFLVEAAVVLTAYFTIWKKDSL